MGKLFKFGLVTAIIGAIILSIAWSMIQYAPLIPFPPYQVKLVAIFVLFAGLTMVISGIVCIALSTAIGEEALAKAMGMPVTQLTPEVIKTTILIIIIIGSIFALVTGRLSQEYFMQIIFAIFGMIGGAIVTYAISKLSKPA